MRPEEEPIAYTTVEKPQWTDISRAAIVCRVQFGHLPMPEEFVCRADDKMPYTREIFRRCLNGEFGPLSVAAPGRSAKLPKGELGVSYYIGDVISYYPDPTLQDYIKRANLENHSGSETGTVIAWASILDHVLKLLLGRSGYSGNATFNDRIMKTFELGRIDGNERELLDLVRRIRNPFGHEVSVSLSDEPQKGLCKRLYQGAIGDGANPSLRLQFSGACCELLGCLAPRVFGGDGAHSKGSAAV